MRQPKRLMFSTAGIPLSTRNRSTLNGISQVRELGLDGMELEFVRGVNMSEELAEEVGKKAKEKEIFLTCHAPYYINLNAKEMPKVHASMNRIKKSAKVLDKAGGWSVCFHPGYYLDMEKKTVFENIKERIKQIVSDLEEMGNKVWIRPETTGKTTQFGNLDELLDISQEVERVMPVIDFSHLHARTNGKYNTKEEFREIFTKVENKLGKEGLNNVHSHLSGIEYGEKGERKHLNLEESDMNFKELLEVWKEFDIKGVVVSENPNIEKDALMIKKLYNKIG